LISLDKLISINSLTIGKSKTKLKYLHKKPAKSTYLKYVTVVKLEKTL
jgi:hypothetical protein